MRPTWIDAFPAGLVEEIHLAGHSRDPLHGDALLIDSHDAPVDAAVWALYRRLVARIGPRPTLIERDGNLPGFDALLAERAQAQALLEAALTGRAGAAGGRMKQRDRALRPTALARFQDAFARALLDDGAPDARCRRSPRCAASRASRSTAIR